MVPHRYPWKRFWCPPTGVIALTAEGYLADPEGPTFLGRSDNPAARPFDALAEVPCLVLLGEPGLGKTTELEAQVAHAANDGPLGHCHVNSGRANPCRSESP